MKLKSVEVRNFKSVDDSTPFDIDEVTCLVGKNEAGKTALLEALYKLNPVEEEKATFEERTYPRRHLTTARQREGRTSANVLRTTWELEDTDVDAMEKRFGKGVIKSRNVIVSKGYDNSRDWTIQLNEAKFVDHVLAEKRLNAAEGSPFRSTHTTGEAVEALRALETPTEKQSSLLKDFLKLAPEANFGDAVQTALADRLPKFLYFDTYHQLPGVVALTDLMRKRQEADLSFGDKIFLSLLDLTSSSLDDIESSPTSEQLIMELEAIEASLTDEIKEFWSQNRHLEVKFRFDRARPEDPPPFNEGFIFNTRIFNVRHRASVNFDERSSGFIWFFSFLIFFSQVKMNYGENLIVLLDEPGLSLHGKAQIDLIRYINVRLRPSHQVIYSSHSPFMIDVENIFSLRGVEDVVKVEEDAEGNRTELILGTKVSNQILTRDEDTLFPLQGILGFDMAQTLFVGPYVLVVEGPSEKALFDWFSLQLEREGKIGLDIRWAVCPAEGAPKITSFVTLFAGRGLKMAVFADYHDGQKRMLDSLEESGLLEKDRLLKTSDYVGHDADIEDVVGRPMYIELVNDCLSLSPSHRLPAEEPDDAPERVVKEVEAHCRSLPPGYSEFSHYLPVDYLLNLPIEKAKGLPGYKAAAKRFEKIFKDLNGLINSRSA